MEFKRIIDLSESLDPRTVWMREDEPDPVQEGSGLWGKEREARAWRETLRIERWLEPPPNQGLVEFITMCAHTGTHVDSEYQQDPKGQMLYDMPLDAFFGQAVSLDMTFVGAGKEMRAEHLERVADKIDSVDAIFLYSEYSTRKKAPLLIYESALWLAEKGIKAFGTGGISIYHDRRSHELCHRKRIAVYDRLDTDGLKLLTSKRFFFVGFPLRINYLAASPCRVIAFEE
jgi:kynurenine formamidase